MFKLKSKSKFIKDSNNKIMATWQVIKIETGGLGV